MLLRLLLSALHLLRRCSGVWAGSDEAKGEEQGGNGEFGGYTGAFLSKIKSQESQKTKENNRKPLPATCLTREGKSPPQLGRRREILAEKRALSARRLFLVDGGNIN